jgi:hypothetical protein
MRKWLMPLQAALMATILTACGSNMNQAEATTETLQVMNQTVEILRPEYRALPKGAQPQIDKPESCWNAVTNRDGGKVQVRREYIITGLSARQFTTAARRVEKFWDDELGATGKESRGFAENEPWVTMDYEGLELRLRMSIYEPKVLSIEVESSCI